MIPGRFDGMLNWTCSTTCVYVDGVTGQQGLTRRIKHSRVSVSCVPNIVSVREIFRVWQRNMLSRVKYVNKLYATIHRRAHVMMGLVVWTVSVLVPAITNVYTVNLFTIVYRVREHGWTFNCVKFACWPVYCLERVLYMIIVNKLSIPHKQCNVKELFMLIAARLYERVGTLYNQLSRAGSHF